MVAQNHCSSIEIAVTVEPGDDEIGPKKPLRAIQVVNGYMLRDPDKKNRMSVWFTGGKLAPFFPDENPMEEWEEYGSFEEWKALFDQEYTSSWSESFKNMGAKLLLGAQLPQGMQPDGSLSYSLTRPYGGHGKSFIDVSFVCLNGDGCRILPASNDLLCRRSCIWTKDYSSLVETMERFMLWLGAICCALLKKGGTRLMDA